MAVPTSIAVSVDEGEYSRFETGLDVITYTIDVVGAGMVGEEVTVELVKARRNRDVSIAYVTHVLATAGDHTVTGTFDLKSVLDVYGVPKARRGKYTIRATAVSDDTVTADSGDFLISLVSVSKLKDEFVYGLDLKATEALAPLEQPRLITGVTITEVSVAHTQDWITLAYNVVDAGGGSYVRTLSWCGGPQVTITTNTRTYILRKGSSADWIRIRVSSILDLPASSVSEDIFITSKAMDDNKIRAILDQAISWIEDVELFVFLEPTTVVTKIDPGVLQVDTDVPVFASADWDEVVTPVTYTQPTAGHWINFKMPYKPVIRFNELYGEVSGARVIEMETEWIKVHEKTGFVELMPFNQSTAFNFLGLSWVQSIRGPVPLPNFWNYEAVCGFRDTPAILIELVAKKAAMDVLTIAGLAKRPGISSQSISRDGVSESVSYTASATAGIYSTIIKDYKDFIDDNIKHIRGAFRGPGLFVL